MELTKVIIKPIIMTEKSTHLRLGYKSGDMPNMYSFEVALESSKTDIKNAVETLFHVPVKSVNTMITRGKTKRVGKLQLKSPNRKKAYVTLPAGETIDVFEGA